MVYSLIRIFSGKFVSTFSSNGIDYSLSGLSIITGAKFKNPDFHFFRLRVALLVARIELSELRGGGTQIGCNGVMFTLHTTARSCISQFASF